MPEVTIEIGGRGFDVACQEGEEHYLQSAARLLDTEAQALLGQVGRLPEPRMLLMSGLMLADKTAGLEEELRRAQASLGAMRDELAAAQAQAATPQRVEVPVVPQAVTDTLAELAARAEALADQAETMASDEV